MILATLKMLLALGAVCLLLFFLARLLKRWDWNRNRIPADNGIKVLASKLIAPQKYVSLVEIGGEVLALGVSAQQITFLTKIENKEMVKKELLALPVRPEWPSWLRGWALQPKKGKEESLGVGKEK